MSQKEMAQAQNSHQEQNLHTIVEEQKPKQNEQSIKPQQKQVKVEDHSTADYIKVGGLFLLGLILLFAIQFLSDHLHSNQFKNQNLRTHQQNGQYLFHPQGKITNPFQYTEELDLTTPKRYRLKEIKQKKDEKTNQITKQTNNIQSSNQNQLLKNYNLIKTDLQFNSPQTHLGYNQIVKKFIQANIIPDGDQSFFINSDISYDQMIKASNYRSFLEKQDKNKEKQEFNYYQSKYKISKYKQLPFCIVVNQINPKNQKYERTLQSIIQQDYLNYHVIYYGNSLTLQNIAKLIQNHSLKNKFTLLKSNKKDNLQNTVDAAINHCKTNEILLRLNSNDEIIGKQVLKLFNALYNQNQDWIIYTNSITSQNRLGHSRAFKDKIRQDNEYRSAPFTVSHLLSFYTNLVTKINKKDLQDSNGKYFKGKADAALLIPLLEMSHQKVKYVNQITYYQFEDSLTKQQTKSQHQIQKQVKKMHKYNPIKEIFDKK